MKGGGGERKLGRNKGRHSETNKNVLFLWEQEFSSRFKINKKKTKEKQDGLPEENKHQKEKAKRRNQY